MNRDALFSDGTASYVVPQEAGVGETIEIRFRTAVEDVDVVNIITAKGSEPMKKAWTNGTFDYYSCFATLTETTMRYYFEIKKDQEVCYYHRCGVSDNVVEYYSFQIVPGFATPDWAKGAVMYQIFVDRFCNGDLSNDVQDWEYIYIGEPCHQVHDWKMPPTNPDIRNFYGGDLAGVMSKLDYLQDLGVEVIYFNPLFVSPSNHKYDIQDYDYIDPHYGRITKHDGEVLPEDATDNIGATMYQNRTGDIENLEASNELFVQLVEEMHKRGMKVILDGVFNHCGSFNKWMDRERIYEQQEAYEKGAYVSQDSPYHTFFHFSDENPENWPYNFRYDGWWGHDTLPKLNYEDSPILEQYIMDIGKKWVSPPYNIDGWRLDVAADLGYSNEYNHMFWRRFRKEIKSANPNALIIAEHYGDPKEWLRGDEWDSVMNYDAFMEPLTWFLTGMEKHSDERRIDLWGNAENFVNSMNHFMASMLTPSLQVAMNELSNHDHSRFLTRTNHIVGRVENLGTKAAEEGVDIAVMREAVMMQMTWVGAPTLYYGDEVGVCGFTDPDNRRTFPWGDENQDLLSFHKDMIRIHKEYNLLRMGSIRMLYWESNILAYARFEGEEQIVVIVNNSKDLREIVVPVWMAEVPMESYMRRIIYTHDKGYTTEPDEYIVQNGEIVLNLGKHSAIVLKH